MLSLWFVGAAVGRNFVVTFVVIVCCCGLFVCLFCCRWCSQWLLLVVVGLDYGRMFFVVVYCCV